MGKDVQLKYIKSNPEKYLLTNKDIANSYVLIECFMEYIPDIMYDRSCLSQINYHFQDKELVKIQEEFIQDLHELDMAHKAEKDAKGRKVYLHGLEKIAQSIRY